MTSEQPAAAALCVQPKPGARRLSDAQLGAVGGVGESGDEGQRRDGGGVGGRQLVETDVRAGVSDGEEEEGDAEDSHADEESSGNEGKEAAAEI